MFVRILKACQCTRSYWYDRHAFDRWKDDLWEKREQEEMLPVGQVIKAARVRPLPEGQDRCCIDVELGEMAQGFLGVPWDCIEIVDEYPGDGG